MSHVSELAELLRPELGGLTKEIVAELDDESLRQGVEDALTAFLRRLADPGDPLPEFTASLRAYGRAEAYAGRGLDALQTSCRLGLQAAWRRMMRIGELHALPAARMSYLTETVFAFVDEIVAAAREGYAQAEAAPTEQTEQARGRLLRLILERPAVPHSAILEAARPAGWTVPGQVTPVAFQPGSRILGTGLHPDLLLDLASDQPILLIPGDFTVRRREMLAAALAGHRAAVGVSVSCHAAADSLRWARKVLALANTGIIEDSSLTFCDDHLLTLWLMSDPMLLDQLGRRNLAALDGMTPWQRHRITETLGAWLEARGNAVEVAERLHVHPQTVRYRMRQIRQIFGDQIDDPRARFELELGVRAVKLRAARTAAPRPAHAGYAREA